VRNAGLLVERDKLPPFGDACRGVEGAVCIGFRGDAAGNCLQNLAAEGNEEVVKNPV